MVVHCVAYGCNNLQDPRIDISFHTIRAAIVNANKQEIPSTSSLLQNDSNLAQKVTSLEKITTDESTELNVASSTETTIREINQNMLEIRSENEPHLEKSDNPDTLSTAYRLNYNTSSGVVSSILTDIRLQSLPQAWPSAVTSRTQADTDEMPQKCSVPGCRSNYIPGSKQTVFSFPKAENRRREWVRAIRRDFVPNQNSRVCILHFADRYVTKIDRFTRDDGTVLEVPRKIPKLDNDAVPTIFPNLPAYMSRKVPLKRKDPLQRQREIERNIKKKKVATFEFVNWSQTDATWKYDIPLNTVRLKPYACPSIFPHDTSSSTKSGQRRKQEFEVKCEPNEFENNVEDQSQDIDNISEPDAITVKTEDLIEFEYVDVKKIEEEQPKIFNILWNGYINLPNEFWATNKILQGKKYIVITKYTITQDEIPVQEKQVLIHENLTLTYFVLNKAFNTHCMPVSVTSVEEIENGLIYFDGLLVSECLGTQ